MTDILDLKGWQSTSEKLADQTKAADHWMGEACKNHNDLVRANEKLEEFMAQKPVAWLYEVNGRIKLETKRIDNYWRGEGDSWVKGKPLFLAAGEAPAPNAELVEALEDLMSWQVKNVKRWHNSAYDNAARVLKKLEAGAAPVPRMTGAALASQEPVAEVLLVDGEKVIDASMAFFDSVELGTKLYLAAGAAPVPDIAAMVGRFLSWTLPKDFGPDCGISFDGRLDDDWNKNKTWPVGTNLLTAVQAREMLEYVLAAAPKEPTP